jgi:hypothetical protein
MLIPVAKNRNNLEKKLKGFYGRFLHGANVETMFMQSVIKCDWLHNIKLIEEIEGSDRWPVRDLFQRGVDHNRVKDGLIPYFENDDKVKFFNPLTLVLLPMDGQDIVSELDSANTQSEMVRVGEELYDFSVSGNQKYFKFFEHSQGSEFSHVAWDDEKVKIVAVDGQHRLTALKELWRKSESPQFDEQKKKDIANMSIPVVLLGFFKFQDEGKAPANLLEVVRSTFVTINSKAQAINESRRILLDDESVNCVCTQEIVEYAHSNDQSTDNYDKSRMPLMMVDWRGGETKGKKDPAPTAIFDVKDIHDWLHEYILGDPHTEKEIENRIIPNLSLDNLRPEFKISDFPLNYDNSKILREKFKKSLLPAIMYTIENIEPFSKYISTIRNEQKEAEKQHGDAGVQAFKWLNFGKSNVTIINRNNIEAVYKYLCSKFGNQKEADIHELLLKDIGIRSIWSSFAILKKYRDELDNETKEYQVFAKWYVGLFNNVFSSGWFARFQELDQNRKKYLVHVAYNTSEGIINYKLSDVNKGLGALVAMLIAKESNDKNLINKVWNDHSKDALTATVRRGLKREVTREITHEAFTNQHEYNKKRDSLTLKRTNKWISNLHAFLEIDD